MLTASRLNAYQMKGAESEYRKVKRLFEKEKVFQKQKAQGEENRGHQRDLPKSGLHRN